MATYVALLRGIGPSDPNTSNKRLKNVFESLGFGKVSPVITSGNVVFDARSKNIPALEVMIEKAIAAKLARKKTVIIRTKEHLERLIRKDPFKGIKDEKPNYLIVTFFKDGGRERCTVLRMGAEGTPAFMRALERTHGKAITTRTWKTVGRILAKMDRAAS